MADEIKATENTEVKNETPAPAPAPAVKEKKPRGRKPADKTKTAKKEAVKTTKKETVKTASAAKKTDKVEKAPAKKATPGRKKSAAPRTTKAVKKVGNASEKAVDSGINFSPVTVELDENKKYSEAALQKKVNDYLKAHPYITAKNISIFVVPKESKAYFTVDGYGNSDFSFEL